MKITCTTLTFFLLGLLFSTAQANTADASLTLAKYCDCYRFQTPNLPVFARAQNGRSLAHYRSHAMQNCVDIRLDLEPEGQIKKILVGDGSFDLKDLSPGPVYFGVRKKIAHSMELVDFDPERGGILRFSYLKHFGLLDAFQDDFSIFENGQRRAKTAAELREVLAEPHWSELDLLVERDHQQRWVLKDQRGIAIHEILALMKGRQLIGLGFATGIVGMVLASDSEKPAFSEYRCRKAR